MTQQADMDLVEMDVTMSSTFTVAERRKLLLNIALRRAQAGSGSADIFLRERTAVRTWPDLSGVLGDIPWAVVGAVATRAYMPERATQDLDLLVRAVDAQEVGSRLQKAGFDKVSELLIGGASWRAPTGVLIDVIEMDAEWVAEALRSIQRGPQGLPILALPYLVLTKVQAGRTQDLADVARMLGLASEEARQATRDVFTRWFPEALEDLESLITLGQLEVEGPQ